MSKFVHQLQRFVHDEGGATMVEYAFMLVLIALVCVGLVATVGTNASSLFTANGNAVANALGGP